ncbi:hypothetical protein M431DRAFT_212603 [Trichoderma harzianum CBS 226.95]|uniref:Uncharacterized protein n=1 Tax=Trichoderma harzianum CBS 226.95 TaxID=983964 RepID=A0A2T4A5E3_TRIHA|nr:hypothetical protein M431DRAFT_212603 [Trichoderma harzianum CBS 226.95]PTB52193.1 hypothetical protein M431DRAFT_212603 [Trichoderma harzianum CBS 226.95]
MCKGTNFDNRYKSFNSNCTKLDIGGEHNALLAMDIIYILFSFMLSYTVLLCKHANELCSFSFMISMKSSFS